MTRALYIRLSVVMFAEYFIAGATTPILSHYLKNHLGFAPFEVGVILAMPAVAAIFAPLVTARVADRYISAERLLALCHFASAVLMTALYFETSYAGFLGLYLLYGMAFMPTYALTNVVALHHCTNARSEFGVVRGMGTIGWIVVAWVFGFLWLRGGGAGTVDDRLPDALVLSALSSLALAVFTLTMPVSAHASTARSVSPWQSAGVFLRPSLLLLCAVAFANGVLNQYYHYGMSPFLSRIGYVDAYIMPAMSLGQIPEIGIMAALGWFLARLGLKRAMLIGVVLQAVRFAAFATSHPLLVLAAIPTHGISYTLFFMTAFLYLDEHCPPGTRASAQLIFSVIVGGAGSLVGSLLAGATGKAFAASHTGAIDFGLFWLVPAGIAAASTLAMAWGFREEPTRQAKTTAT